MKCPTCQKDFEQTKSRKKFCSQECYLNSAAFGDRVRKMQSAICDRHRAKYPNGKPAPHLGICAQCNQEFRARYKDRKFCSMKCYVSSDQFKNASLANSRNLAEKARAYHGLQSSERLRKKCASCEIEFYVQPHKFSSHKYCSRTCYRRYMADRFDRWIANPQGIALPQCYDEFLIQEELPCLIDGCDWTGKQLGNHVNFAHGITADEFKEIAGFNRHTGLVSPDISQAISLRQKSRMAAAMAQGYNPPILPRTSSQSKERRLEGKEHFTKARAILTADYRDTPDIITCMVCNTDAVKISLGGKHLYCSIKCRSEYYASRRWEMECCQCSQRFLGDQYQWRRVRKGLDVCCSLECRNARNIVFTPNYQKAHMGNNASENKPGSPTVAGEPDKLPPSSQ